MKLEGVSIKNYSKILDKLITYYYFLNIQIFYFHFCEYLNFYCESLFRNKRTVSTTINTDLSDIDHFKIIHKNLKF